MRMICISFFSICPLPYLFNTSPPPLSRAPVVEVGPQSSAYLRLWFAPQPRGIVPQEVLLFLNDAAEGQNEECHLFKVYGVEG